MNYLGDDYNELINHNGFRYKRIEWKTASIISMVEDGGLNIQPYFRTHTDWRIVQRSNFIESLFLGMPVGNIICEENSFGEFTVLDGTQRLKTIFQFINNEFSLEDLKLLKHLNYKNFDDLNYNDRSLIKNRVTLNFLSISYDTHPVLKFEFFKRINYGQTRFPIQSARNYAFPQTKYLIEEIKESLPYDIKFIFQNPSRYKSALFLTVEIDQLYLYLLLIMSLHYNAFDSEDHDETIMEALDQCASYFNSNEIKTGILIDSLNDHLKHTFNDFPFLRKINILHRRPEASDLSFRTFLNIDKLDLDMDMFIHIFLLSFKNKDDNIIADMLHDNDTLYPDYQDIKKSTRFLKKQIFGIGYDKHHRIK